MLKNYFHTALRFLRKNTVFAAINVIGLSLALATSFIILLFAINELSYENFHKNRKQVYRVLTHLEDFNTITAGNPYPLESALEEEFPQVERAINTRRVRGFKLKLNEDYIDIWNAVGTESALFDIFTIEMVYGSRETGLLDNPNAIVLSRELADKFFPGENPVGKDIHGIAGDTSLYFVVTGVFENMQENSTLRAECFVDGKWTLGAINQAFRSDDAGVNWDYDFWNTWVMLSKDIDPESLESQFRALEKKNIPEGRKKHYSLQNLKEVYLGSDEVQNSFIKGSRSNIRLFSGIAILIVLIAAMNHIILSTALSTSRAKEIGIRKMAGAGDKNIRFQLLGESVLLTILVLPIAILLMWIGLPYAEAMFDTKLRLIPTNIPAYIVVYLIVTLLIGIASGLYTAAYLSRLRVNDILNNAFHFGRGKVVFRAALIVLQLVIFCSFVAGTMIIRSQYKFAVKKDPGYYTSNIFVVKLGRDFAGYTPFLERLKSNPDIVMSAGAMEGLPMINSASMMYPHSQNRELRVKVEGLFVDFDFLETVGIEVKEGRDFSREYVSDKGEAVILNRQAVSQLGIINPLENRLKGKKIIGIVEDFNLHSIHTEIPPLKIELTERFLQEIVVHYAPGKLDEVLKMVKEEWERIEPDRPFSYSLIEEIIDELYAGEKRLTTIVSISSVFALIIACMGIFGLTLFMAKSRTNEIGIRKVFGSGEWPIIRSFLTGNFVMVLIAEVISIPVTLYFAGRWLDNFSYRVSISWWPFALSFIIASAMVLLTVYIQSYRASRLNPVDALRYN